MSNSSTNCAIEVEVSKSLTKVVVLEQSNIGLINALNIDVLNTRRTDSKLTFFHDIYRN